MKKKITILGSTGSIGINALKIINLNKNSFFINVLMANSNLKRITSQLKKYKPKYFIISDPKIYKIMLKKFKNSKTKIINSYLGLSNLRNDITLSAISGIAGLEPTIFFSKKSKKLLLANKESIICGWKILEKTIKKNKTNLIPLDSEHFSLMKLLEKEKEEIERIYITASGGPFLRKKNIKNIRPNEALKHPKWSMGKKISIDSATLMNKIFEIEEARLLFPKIAKKIDIIIHPQSLVHAIIQLKNGTSKFIFHNPDMRIPIANAIYDSNLDIKKIIKKDKNEISGKLEFMKINKKNFPPLKFVKAINRYTSSPIIINAANEILVDMFLRKIISFGSIIRHLGLVLTDKKYKKYAIKKPKNIKEIMAIDLWARKTTLNLTK